MTPIRTLLVDDSLPFLKYLGLLLSRLPQLLVIGSATTMPEAFALAKLHRRIFLFERPLAVKMNQWICHLQKVTQSFLERKSQIMHTPFLMPILPPY